MATINGAKALGIGDKTGSLEIGKAADFISVSIAETDMVPMYEPISHLVYAASRRSVRHVWVAGKQLVQDRRLTTMDEQSVYKQTLVWQERITNADPTEDNAS